MCSSRLFTNLFYILFEIKFRVALVYFIFSVCFFLSGWYILPAVLYRFT